MATVQVGIDNKTRLILTIPQTLMDVVEREQAIGEARTLVELDTKVRNKIAEIEKELAEHERPDAAKRRSDAVEESR